MNRLLASLALCAAAGAASAAPQLVMPGENFHGDEVPARDGESWFALVVAGGKAHLQSTRLRVEAVNDPIMDGPDDRTGRSVAAAGIEARVFLRGIAALKSGEIPVAVAEPTALSATEPLAVRLGDATLRLVPHCADSGDESGGLACTVGLNDGTSEQTLFTTYGARENGVVQFGDVPPTVLFAGDLDRDGRLDLIIDTTDHYNLSRPTLFLSGAAKTGEQVAETAQQQISGC